MSVAQFSDAVSNQYGNPVPFAEVRVYTAQGGSLATLYTDETGAEERANPVYADAYGNYQFYAAPGYYWREIWLSDTILDSRTIMLGLNAPIDVDSITANTASLGAVNGIISAVNGIAEAVAQCGANPSTIVISTALTLAADLSVPDTIHLSFTRGGKVSGSHTLTINGTLEAPEDAQIFGNDITVAGLLEVRPEWFGVATLKKAVDALSSDGGTVLLRKAAYLSDLPGGAVGLFKDNVTLKGSGKPTYNDDFSQMENGTIIQGRLQVVANNFHAYDLGVDSGKTVTDTLFAGVEMDAFAINSGQTVGTPPLHNLILHNIACLAYSATSNYHSLLTENVDHADIRNITTRYGIHGFAFKGQWSVIDGVDARGHGDNGLIIKSNDWAVTDHNSFNNIKVSSIAFSPMDTGGVRIQAYDNDISGLTLNNVVLNAVNYGVNLDALAGHSISGVSINNLSVEGWNGVVDNGSAGVDLTGAGSISRLNINNVYCANMDRSFDTADTLTMGDVKIANWTAVNLEYEGMVLGGNVAVANSGITNCTWAYRAKMGTVRLQNANAEGYSDGVYSADVGATIALNAADTASSATTAEEWTPTVGSLGEGDAAITQLQMSTKGTGTGPVSNNGVKWLKVNISGTDYWLPLFQ